MKECSIEGGRTQVTPAHYAIKKFRIDKSNKRNVIGSWSWEATMDTYISQLTSLLTSLNRLHLILNTFSAKLWNPSVLKCTLCNQWMFLIVWIYPVVLFVKWRSCGDWLVMCFNINVDKSGCCCSGSSSEVCQVWQVWSMTPSVFNYSSQKGLLASIVVA